MLSQSKQSGADTGTCTPGSHSRFIHERMSALSDDFTKCGNTTLYSVEYLPVAKSVVTWSALCVALNALKKTLISECAFFTIATSDFRNCEIAKPFWESWRVTSDACAGSTQASMSTHPASVTRNGSDFLCCLGIIVLGT
jgi:hypothetical protein